MRPGRLALFSTIALALTVPAIAASHARRTTTSSKSLSKRTLKSKAPSQRTIDDDRATQIQAALIKAGYLSGTPSGHWDGESEAAMGKLQADNGWQTKLVPDSRALIKLGLGPNTAPVPASSAALAGSGGSFAAAQPGPMAQAPQ